MDRGLGIYRGDFIKPFTLFIKLPHDGEKLEQKGLFYKGARG